MVMCEGMKYCVLMVTSIVLVLIIRAHRGGAIFVGQFRACARYKDKKVHWGVL